MRAFTRGVVAACLLLGGCVHVNIGKHVAAPDYNVDVKRVAVMMPDDDTFGSGFAGNFSASFKEAVQTRLDGCGIATMVYQTDPMQLDGLAKAQTAIAAFQPGNLLTVQHTKRVLMGGEDRAETYVFTLSDLAQRRDVWKGTIGVSAGTRLSTDRSHSGADLATALVGLLAADHVLGACTAPALTA